MKLKTALIVSLLYFFPASARQIGFCDFLLAGHPQNKQLEFQLSDLETLYLEIVEESVLISNGDAKYVKDKAENYMKKKTEFLNDAIPALRKIRSTHRPSLELQNERDLIYTMIATLGADVDGMKVITKPYKKRKGQVKKPPVKPRSIGFLEPGNDDGTGPSKYVGFGNTVRSTGTDLPEGMHRSIGFGPQTIESRVQTPIREFGKISIEMSEDQHTVIVTDLLTDAVHNVKKKFMVAGDAEAEFKSFAIDYDSTEGEWILRYVNLANPEGKIGF